MAAAAAPAYCSCQHVACSSEMKKAAASLQVLSCPATCGVTAWKGSDCQQHWGSLQMVTAAVAMDVQKLCRDSDIQGTP
jgi:hypothetical protein